MCGRPWAYYQPMATQAKSEQSVIDRILERLEVLERRISDVERRLGIVEIDLAIIKSNYATKEDIVRTHEAIAKLEIKMVQMETRLIRWFIGTALTLVTVSASLAFLVARLIH
jgi:archaellum component FlaC